MAPRASILVPAHNHAATLPLAVQSALRQSVSEVEVLIIGDGVSTDVRAAADKLVASDSRVRFLDYAKGENHGEIYRHTAIQEASSDAIFYLCDDDILMRDHVADLLELLKRHNFVQCKNGYFTVDGEVEPYPTDLSDPVSVAQHLRTDIVFNGVSITGTAHSKKFYLDAGVPWTTTPRGEFPDHYQWRKLMQNPAFSGATSSRMTALQFPSSNEGRAHWTANKRLDEISVWAKVAATAGGQAKVDALVARGDRRALVRDRIALSELVPWRDRRTVIFAVKLSTVLSGLPIIRRFRQLPTPNGKRDEHRGTKTTL